MVLSENQIHMLPHSLNLCLPPPKLKIALRLRQQTTMTLAWIAQRLQMGTKTHLSHLLYWDERGKS